MIIVVYISGQGETIGNSSRETVIRETDPHYGTKTFALDVVFRCSKQMKANAPGARIRYNINNH